MVRTLRWYLEAFWWRGPFRAWMWVRWTLDLRFRLLYIPCDLVKHRAFLPSSWPKEWREGGEDYICLCGMVPAFKWREKNLRYGRYGRIFR